MPPALKRTARRADAAPVVQRIVEFMDGMPSLPLVFLYSALIGPLLVAIHELGHAAAALWRSSGPVVVRIGARRRRFALRSGRLRVEADELAQCGGFCAYDPTGLSGPDVAAIALAGPAASLAGAAVTGLLWAYTGGPLQDVLSVATLGGVLLGVVNALPLTYQARKNGDELAVRLDGLHAREALRRRAVPAAGAGGDVKAGPIAERWADEVTAASERARAERARTNVARLRARDAERRQGSVPPPER